MAGVTFKIKTEGLDKMVAFTDPKLFQRAIAAGIRQATLSVGELAVAMARLFGLAPWDVRAGLVLPAQKPPGWQGQAAP